MNKWLGAILTLVPALTFRTMELGAGVGKATGRGVGVVTGRGVLSAGEGVGPSGGQTTKSFSSTVQPGGMVGVSAPASPSNGGRVNSGLPPSQVA